MAQPSHIFIVGLFRTGTSLLRYALNSSTEIAICNETKFLRKGFMRRGYCHRLAKVGDLSTEAGVQDIVDYIYVGDMAKSWSHINKAIAREELFDSLLKSDRSHRALFDLIMHHYANGKPIRGDKTPAHIYQVPRLMEWFPNAKIIHTIRDPRAIFVSEKRRILKRKTLNRRYSALRQSEIILGIYVYVHVLLAWLRAVYLHHQYQKRYPNNYYLVRFEDLVINSETTLKKVCDFLEIDFREAMLNQPVVGSSFVREEGQIQGFDTSTIDRWRNHLHPALDKWFVFCTKKYLLELGYQ